MNLPHKLQERKERLVQDFQSLGDWEERYHKIIDMGRELPPMHEAHKIESNLVKGCQSQLWLSAELREGKITFHADSDAAISKGIVALLVNLYNGSAPREILHLDQSFIDELGLRQHLSMSRANGLASVLKQMHFYALAFEAKQREGGSACP